jgi:Protein of unknown function (DUF4065)
MPRFQPKRFEELILYVAERTAEDPDFGSTKLAKTLFYSDFEAYRLLGEPITGARYENWKYGPYPPGLSTAAGRLESRGRIKVIPPEREYETQRFLPTRWEPADLSAVGITTEQVEIVDRWIQRIKRASTAAIKRLSHDFAGYKIVGRNETISYKSAFLATEAPSDEDVDAARRIAEDRGWLVGNEWRRS